MRSITAATLPRRAERLPLQILHPVATAIGGELNQLVLNVDLLIDHESRARRQRPRELADCLETRRLFVDLRYLPTRVKITSEQKNRDRRRDALACGAQHDRSAI